MDTLGNSPSEMGSRSDSDSSGQELPLDDNRRLEALERLRYLAIQGQNGLLTGPRGSGKTTITRELVESLQREGVPTARINLNGLDGDDLAFTVASRIGFGIETFDTERTIWALLEDFAESNQHTGQRNVIIFDNVDRICDDAVPKLDRLLSLFEHACSCLFTAKSKLKKPIKPLLKTCSELKIEIADLTEKETELIVEKKLADMPSSALPTQEAIQAMQKISKGRVHRLTRLAELCSLAAEIDECDNIDKALVEAIAREMVE